MIFISLHPASQCACCIPLYSWNPLPGNAKVEQLPQYIQTPHLCLDERSSLCSKSSLHILPPGYDSPSLANINLFKSYFQMFRLLFRVCFRLVSVWYFYESDPRNCGRQLAQFIHSFILFSCLRLKTYFSYTLFFYVACYIQISAAQFYGYHPTNQLKTVPKVQCFRTYPHK